MVSYLPPILYYTRQSTLEEFILGMLTLGTLLEVSLVGAFDPASPGRGSRQDIDLPLHQDGVYSAALAAVQGGHYVERNNIDIVGLYCIRGSNAKEQCLTLLNADLANGDPDKNIEIDLRPRQALVFDNRKLLHGRRGPVGSRVLMRVWVQKHKKV